MTKLNNRLQEILNIKEFRQNDVVEDMVYKETFTFLRYTTKIFAQVLERSQLSRAEHLKLINRNFTLSDVLEAWKKHNKKKRLTYLHEQHLTVYFDIITLFDIWQLGKGVDEQNEECKDFLTKILGE